MITFGQEQVAYPFTLSTERLHTRDSPQDIFVKVQEEFENAFLLESAKGETRLAEYSFIGFEPQKLVRIKDGCFEVVDYSTGIKEKYKVTDPLRELRRLVMPRHMVSPFRFIGGAVGYISYDSVRYWERLPSLTEDDLALPDMEFGIYTDGIVFDHINHEIYYYTLGENRVETVYGLLRRRAEGHRGIKASLPRPSLGRAKFEDMVEEAKEHITAGDIFQVVLSKRYDFRLSGDLMRFYTLLSTINPSPYMYFLKFGPRQIVGSSPEMLARVEGRRVETFPIAGTHPHVADRRKNARLTRELLADQKERAEHVMLVDLARNDLGRVAKYGSVKVPELMTVQQFSHVQHIVSHVVGLLRDEFDAFDAIRAIFPAGTVSGAPKPRAMEIIEELEQVRRGPYAGAVGYFSFNGNADFAITIRTLVANGRNCNIQAGAGIVADSDPAKEWDETNAKAAGLLRALQEAQR